MRKEIISEPSILKSINKAGLYRKYFKRIIDIICSFFALIILSPLLLVIAILVRIKMGSPLIHKAKRVGKNEKIFTLYKFRSMMNTRDENGNLLTDEMRLTNFGRIIRSTSIDELPELFNILKGDMSFIGPRPLPSIYVPYYTEKERRRHEIRPGLSGLAQVNGRNSLSWEQKFTYDIEYIENISFWGDLKIFFKTLIKVFKRSDIGVAGIDNLESFHEYRMHQNKLEQLSE